MADLYYEYPYYWHVLHMGVGSHDKILEAVYAFVVKGGLRRQAMNLNVNVATFAGNYDKKIQAYFCLPLIA
jgi:hypothetical protein